MLKYYRKNPRKAFKVDEKMVQRYYDAFIYTVLDYLRDYNMTGKDIAEKAHISEHTFSTIIGGKTIPKLPTAIAIALAIEKDGGKFLQELEKIYIELSEEK